MTRKNLPLVKKPNGVLDMYKTVFERYIVLSHTLTTEGTGFKLNTMLKLNLFHGFHDTNPNEMTLDEIVQLIKCDPSLKDLTEKHRYYLSLNLSKAADEIKSSILCFGVAVHFAGGKNQRNITDWTRLSLVDIDDVPSERMDELCQKAHNDPHTLLMYRTISGTGIRILFQYEIQTSLAFTAQQRIQFYQQVVFPRGNEYYSQLLGMASDGKCKNCTRLSGIAYDPEVFYRPDARPFVFDEGDVRPFLLPKKVRKVALDAAVHAAEAELEQQGVVFADGSHNDYVMRMGYLLNAYGVDSDAALDWAIGRFATDYDGDIAAIFRSCYQHTEEFGTRKLPRKSEASDKHWATVDEIESFLSCQADFRFNEIRRQCEVSWKNAPTRFTPITDRDENTLWRRMCKEGVSVKLGDIHNIIHSEFVPVFNPFQVYFASLPDWDGVTDYIGELAHTVHVKGNQEEFVRFFTKWLVSVVAGLFDDQTVNHEILVFVGKQGTYKSTFFAKLLPPELQEYFHAKINSNRVSKDDLLSLCEFSLVCLEEIDEMRSSELNTLKAMVTARTISERAAYARNKERRTHIASFCGTGNNTHFLIDHENRRWIAAEVESIDSPYEHPFNYTGIYSQAWALWKSGFKYWLNDGEVVALSERNQEFEVASLEEELISVYFRLPFEHCQGVFMSVSEILERINVSIRQPLSPVRLGIALKKLGFKADRYNGVRGYILVERSADEIRSSRTLIAKRLNKS